MEGVAGFRTESSRRPAAADLNFIETSTKVVGLSQFPHQEKYPKPT